MEGKKWYASKTVWAGIAFTVEGIYCLIQAHIGPLFGWHLPAIPNMTQTLVEAVLGPAAIYGRLSADTKIQ